MNLYIRANLNKQLMTKLKIIIVNLSKLNFEEMKKYIVEISRENVLVSTFFFRISYLNFKLKAIMSSYDSVS